MEGKNAKSDNFKKGEPTLKETSGFRPWAVLEARMSEAGFCVRVKNGVSGLLFC